MQPEGVTGKACKYSTTKLAMMIANGLPGTSGADPYLTGEAAYETILGMQSTGVQAWYVFCFSALGAWFEP